jgi:hypothetical protein
MYSDAVSQVKVETKVIETNGNGFHKPAVYEKWQDWFASEISHHGGMCCEIAREWITSTDFSELGGSSIYTGPRWLRLKFNWGASSFPIYWCEAVRKKTLDCGALAALASEIFNARGVKNYRLQMVQRYSEVSTSQWSNSWHDTSEQLRWMNDDLIYHEGCAVQVSDSEVKIWDASAGWWVDPKTKDGYGSLLAARLSGYNLPSGVCFDWGKHRLNAHQWTNIN